METIQLQRSPWKRQPVNFIFDQSDNKEWRQAVIEAFKTYKKDHPKFAEPSFADKMDPENMPLQAADMVAFRTRQITGKFIDQDVSVQWPELDNALFKPRFDYFEAHKDVI